jgi:tetratricopeptide (TPR) repeat protein
MHVFRTLAIVTGLSLTIAPLPAQQGGNTGGGGGATGGGGGAAGGGGTPNNPSPNIGTVPGNNGRSNPNINTPFPSDQNQPIFITGKVVLDDGTPLTESVVIERVCNGNPRPEAHTDGKGRFSFQLGQNREVFVDLSEASDVNVRGRSDPNSLGGIRATDLIGCELRAVLPGYRSDAVSLFNHRYLDNPDVGTIVLHRIANVEGLTTSAISARAPKEARKAYEKGLEAARKNKSDEALKQFEKAVAVYPQYASAWFELGKVHEKENRVADARKAYAQSLAADSKYINPYERLYMLAFKDANWQEVADTTSRVIHLNPYDFPGAYYFNGVANLQLDKLDLAEKSAREAVNMDKAHRNPKTSYVLGLILARRGDLNESAQFLRAYIDAAPTAPDVELVRKQLVQVESALRPGAKPEPEHE